MSSTSSKSGGGSDIEEYETYEDQEEGNGETKHCFIRVSFRTNGDFYAYEEDGEDEDDGDVGDGDVSMEDESADPAPPRRALSVGTDGGYHLSRTVRGKQYLRPFSSRL